MSALPAVAVPTPMRPAESLWRRRNVALGLALGVPASAVFLYLAARNLDAAAVVSVLRRADPLRFAAGVAALCLVYVVQAARWQWIARRHARLSLGRFVELVVAGIACNNAVPGRPGDLLRAHWLGRAGGVSRSRALGTVVVDRAADVLALLAALAVSYAALGHHAGWVRRLDLGAAALGVVVVLTLLGARRHARSIGSGRLMRSRPFRVLSDVLHGMGSTVNRRDAPVVALLSFVAWTLWSLGAWLVASALGIHLSALEVLFVAAVVNLGVALPSSPGFVGTYQWLCVAALGLLAVGREDAFAFSVLLHAAWFVPTSVAGLLLLGARASGRVLETRSPAARPSSA